MLFAVFGLAFILAYLAKKRNKKIYVWILILTLGLFVGCRSRSVGIDTDMYYSIFQNLERGVFSPNIEKEFLLVNYILLRIMKTEQLFMLFSIITNWLIIMRLWSLRSKASFLSMTMLYVMLLYPETANIMRQYLAVAIVFYATIYLERKNPISFFLLIILAFTVHRSAILGLSYYPIYFWLTNSNLNTKAMFGLLLSIIAPVIMAVFLSRFSGNLSLYLSGHIGIGFLYPVEILILLIFYLLNIPNFRSHTYTNENVFLRFIILIYFLGVAFCAMGYYQASLYRLGLYFIIYEIVFIPYICTHGTNRFVFSLIYCILVAFLVFQNHLAGWSGLMNYNTWLA